MSTLCIDLGNTRTHYGLVSRQAVTQSGHFPTGAFIENTSREIEAFADEVAAPARQAESIAFCSVVPEVNKALCNGLRNFDLPIFHLTCENCRGLDLIYPNPHEIGQDRIANAMAAQSFYNTPAIIIDMGTAVTFDIVSREGYEGGIIAPGPAVMTKYLHEQTALLPELCEKDLLNIEGAVGKSTVDAMKLGMVVGFSGMLDALLDKVTQALIEIEKEDSTPEILCTGGSLPHLMKTRKYKGKSRKIRFVPELTLIGLGVAADRNASGV